MSLRKLWSYVQLAYQKLLQTDSPSAFLARPSPLAFKSSRWSVSLCVCPAHDLGSQRQSIRLSVVSAVVPPLVVARSILPSINLYFLFFGQRPRREQSPVEHRGNLSVQTSGRPSIRTYVHSPRPILLWGLF